MKTCLTWLFPKATVSVTLSLHCQATWKASCTLPISLFNPLLSGFCLPLKLSSQRSDIKSNGLLSVFIQLAFLEPFDTADQFLLLDISPVTSKAPLFPDFFPSSLAHSTSALSLDILFLHLLFRKKKKKIIIEIQRTYREAYKSHVHRLIIFTNWTYLSNWHPNQKTDYFQHPQKLSSIHPVPCK